MFENYDPKALRALVPPGSFWHWRDLSAYTVRIKTVRFYGYKDDAESASYPENYWVYYDGEKGGLWRGKYDRSMLDQFVNKFVQITDPEEIEKAVFKRAKYRSPTELKPELGNKHVKHLSAETKGLLLLAAS